MINRNRGSALLAVLWLTAALSAIAFSVAITVRGETERVATGEENVRAYYLAQSAIQRAVLYMQWAPAANRPDGSNPYFVTGQAQMVLNFPSGQAVVDVIPEASKLDLNNAKPATLAQLMMILGANPDQAQLIAAGIEDWRHGNGPGQVTAFDQFYMSQVPSFRAPHASFQEVEELLNLQGMTPELFHGTWVRRGDGGGTRLVPIGGVRDCVSVFGSLSSFDASWVQPAVLAAVGVGPDDIQAVLAFQQSSPVHTQAQLAGFNAALASRLSLVPHTIYTLRATARMRHSDGSFSDLRRTISATVKMLPAGSEDKFHILRWYDRG